MQLSKIILKDITTQQCNVSLWLTASVKMFAQQPQTPK